MTRTLLVVLVAVLAASAGCQSLSQTAGTETATTGDTVETEPASSANRAVSNDTGADAVTFFDTHERTLRAAGNVTVERSSSIRVVNDTGDYTSTSTSEIDLQRGRVLRRTDYFQGGVANQRARHTYQNETGAVFVDFPEWLAASIDVNRTISPLPVENESQLAYRGERTVDGVEGRVYVLDSVEALEADAYRYLQPDNVTEFEVTYVVDERGYVAYQRVNRTVESGDDIVRTRETVRFSNVGSTTVARPTWADEPVGNSTSTVTG